MMKEEGKEGKRSGGIVEENYQAWLNFWSEYSIITLRVFILFFLLAKTIVLSHETFQTTKIVLQKRFLL